MTARPPRSPSDVPLADARPSHPPRSPTRRSALVSGRLSRPAERRDLPSGDSVVTIEVTTRLGAGPAESVPVVWPDAPSWADGLGTGARVVVVGRVRRRFFRAGGRTAAADRAGGRTGGAGRATGPRPRAVSWLGDDWRRSPTPHRPAVPEADWRAPAPVRARPVARLRSEALVTALRAADGAAARSITGRSPEEWHDRYPGPARRRGRQPADL